MIALWIIGTKFARFDGLHRSNETLGKIHEIPLILGSVWAQPDIEAARGATV